MSANKHAVERYSPSLDWWVAAIVGLIVLVLLLAIPTLISSAIGTADKVVGVLALIVVILYLIDITFFSSYYLMPDGLVIVSQLRRHSFPYETMRYLRPGNALGLFSVPGKRRFALSASSLVIGLSEGQWKKISVSPRARQQFVESLLGRAQGIKHGSGKK